MLVITTETLERLRAILRRRVRTGERALEEHRRALSDLDGAERLLSLVESDDKLRRQIQDSGATPPRFEFSPENPYRPGGLRAVIWEVLILSGEIWITTAEVRRQCAALTGKDIPLNSVASTLSRMRSRIARRGGYVAEITRVQSGPDAPPWESETLARLTARKP